MKENLSDELRKYFPINTISIEDAIDRYNKSKSTIIDFAKNADAYVKVEKHHLIDTKKMDLYMDYKYKSGEEYGFYRVFNKLHCDYDFNPEYIEWLKEIYKFYLTTIEQEVLSRLCGIYHEMETSSICAESLSISTQRIHQIRNGAFRKIRCRLVEYYKFEQFKKLDLHLNAITLLSSISVIDTTLSSRAKNALLRSRLANNMYDISQLNIDDLKRVRSCGIVTRNEILEYQNRIKSLFGIYSKSEI